MLAKRFGCTDVGRDLHAKLLEPDADAVLRENSKQRPVVVRRDPRERRASGSVDVEHLGPADWKIHDGGTTCLLRDPSPLSPTKHIRASRHVIRLTARQRQFPFHDRDDGGLNFEVLSFVREASNTHTTGKVITSQLRDILRAFCSGSHHHKNSTKQNERLKRCVDVWYNITKKVRIGVLHSAKQRANKWLHLSRTFYQICCSRVL